MLKLSEINEGLIGNLYGRAAGTKQRREDGIKVKTCLGTEVILNPNINNYNDLISDMFEVNEYASLYVTKTKNLGISSDQIQKIKDFELPYTYMIYDGNYGTDLSVEFTTYNDIVNSELDDFQSTYDEKDYISLCRSVATRLKEIGMYIDYIPSGCWCDNIFRKYNQEYHFKLIDESSIYHWTIDNEDYEDFKDDFLNDIINEFPELENEDFIFWTYNNNAVNIGIPLDLNNTINIEKYIEFTKNWFNI